MRRLVDCESPPQCVHVDVPICFFFFCVMESAGGLSKIGDCGAIVGVFENLDMGGCQNHGPFLGLVRIRHLIFRAPKKGP